MQYLNIILNIIIIALLIVCYYNFDINEKTLINILILYMGFLYLVLLIKPKMAFIMSFIELSCIYMYILIIYELYKILLLINNY